MKNQKKDLRIELSLGGQTLHRVKDGFKIKRKSGVDANRIKTDPAFRNTLLSNSDFTTAANAGRMLREAFNIASSNARDARMSTRLTTSMRSVLKSDPVNVRGQRQVSNGDLTMLEGFQFNVGSPLATSIQAPYTASLNRETGLAQVIIAAYKPQMGIVSPVGATHYVLQMAAAAVDFATGKAETAFHEMLPLPLDMNERAETVLSAQLPANNDKPLFLVFGIHFLTIENGVHYSAGGKAYNAMAIVEVVTT